MNFKLGPFRSGQSPYKIQASMEFSISLSGLKCSLGQFTAVTFEPKDVPPADLLKESSSRARDLDLVFAVDVSGSMAENMKTLIDSILGAIDILAHGSYLRVLSFDTTVREILCKTRVTEFNKAILKDTIKKGLVNTGGLTNLEEILTTILMGLGQHIILLTDGKANRGILQTSDEMLDLARSMPNYHQNTIHCLGLQLGTSDLNGFLMKNLAQETSGTYILAHDLETVSTFFGDVMADHLMGRYKECSVRLAPESHLISNVSDRGFILRADRPTTIVFESPAVGQKAMVHFRGYHGQLDYTIHDVELDVTEASQSAQIAIFKAICAKVLEVPGRPQLPNFMNDLRGLINSGSVHLVNILIKCENILSARQESMASSNIYDLQSLSPETSDTVNLMRFVSLEASQSQDPN